MARSRLRGPPHTPYVFARTPVQIYCYLLLLLGLLPNLLPSNRLILYSYLYTYHVLLVITTSCFVYCYWWWVIYYKNTLITYILAPIRPYVPAMQYTMVGCACRVKLRMTKGVVFFVPYRTAIRSGLTYSGVYYTERNTYVPAVLDHSPCMVGCVCPVESRMTKRVVFNCFDHYEQKYSY